MEMKLSDYVVRRVADLGVRHVFLLPGGGAMHLNDSFGRAPDLELVCNLHEQASAVAAEAWAKTTGQIGAVLVTTGPGGTNAVTGIAGAWLDSTPVLVISGQAKRADLKGSTGVRQRGVQEVDIVSIVQSITKYAITILDPRTIRFHLDRAIHLATTGRPGPVWIDIPLDVQAARIDPDELPGFEPGVPCGTASADEAAKLSAAVARTLELLQRSERPVLLGGNGIRLAGARGVFEEALDRLDIPVLLTWLGIDLLPDADPRFMGRPGAVAPRAPNFALQNADFLLSVGARLDLVLTGYAPEKLARGARKIVVDVDPTELTKPGCHIDVPVCADAGAFFRELLRQAGSLPPKDRSAWWQRCRDWKTRYPLVLPEHLERTGPVSLYALSDVLSDELAEGDTIVSGSSGSGIECFLLVLRVKRGQRVLHTTALGAMGFGPPTAIGACLASGRKRTVVVDGDGGLQLNVQELQTISRLNLPVKLFILNNNVFASIRASQKNHFGRLTCADPSSGVTLPNLADLARAYGIAAFEITDQADLRDGVRRVLDSEGPALCDVHLLLDEDRVPRISSRQQPDGSMASTPLEDLFPYLPREEFLANMIVPPLPESGGIR